MGTVVIMILSKTTYNHEQLKKGPPLLSQAKEIPKKSPKRHTGRVVTYPIVPTLSARAASELYPNTSTNRAGKKLPNHTRSKVLFTETKAWGIWGPRDGCAEAERKIYRG